MKIFLMAILSKLKQVIFSRMFLFSVIGLAVVRFLSVYQEISIFSTGTDSTVLYFYGVGTFIDYWLLFILFAAIPGAPLFCSDWENRFFRFSIVRCSKRIYGAASALTSYISAFLVAFCGEWLFVLILRIGYPFYYEGSSWREYGVYEGFMSEEKILLYFFLAILIKAFCAGFFSVFALWLSTKITNIFVVLASPIIVYYIIENVTTILRLPNMFKISKIIKGQIMINDSLFMTVMYPALLFTILAVIFGVFFTQSAKRRVENG